MRVISKRLLWGAAAGALGWHVVVGFGSMPTAARAQALTAPNAATGPVALYPDKNAWFGDLHLHTTYSFDAFVLMNTRITPDEAYKFARGDTIDYLGQQVRRQEPLDFEAVTDHSENIGVFNQLDDPKGAFSLSDIGKLARAGGYENFVKLAKEVGVAANFSDQDRQAAASAWEKEKAAANANYEPGKFTTFIAYEWTSMPDNQNLHRNVIFKGSDAPAPFTRIDSENPEDLWKWLGRIRAKGYEAIAIPHNSNASNGLMFDWNTLDGRPIDEAYAQLRATNEPVVEVSQNKGTSETHPLLSSNDEFAGFEIWDTLLIGGTDSKKPGSYWRDALGRGLVLQSRLGTNPFKYGTIGAGDLHNGISVSGENDYAGGANVGGAHKTKEQISALLGLTPFSAASRATISSSAALTGVWAETNTRDAIFAAQRRKETFATSGTRIKVRFFGGWNYPAGLLKQPDWVKTAYATGVPMGGDLPAVLVGSAPRFAIQAVKDPHSGNLDRVQVIKVWLEAGKQHEHVFDVAWSGNRKPDPGTGSVPAVGNTVDLKTAKYANTIGAAELAAVWTDPTFKVDQAAVYYVRAIEIPTPRWNTLRAVEYGLPLPKDAPATLQERAWTSPIWYTPAKAN
jgi:hypothetical protein